MADTLYDDYCQRRFGKYFTASFLHKHLRPHCPVPLGGFAESRSRARSGNVSLVKRNQHFSSVFQNSLVFDYDSERRECQVLLLMQEVEGRNSDGEYARASTASLFVTSRDYYVLTTKPGSRHRFSRGALLYAVVAVSRRYVISHYAGVVR